MKNSPSVTRLLAKLDTVIQDIARIADFCRRKNAEAFSVEFLHGPNRELLGMYWSDQYNGGANLPNKSWHLSYSYNITSRGSHFVSFCRKLVDKPSWDASSEHWNVSHDRNTMQLSQVPNRGPADGQSMYTFHQEKIHEALSALPAWAIVVAADY